MLRMYLLQIWFHLSDSGTEDAIYDCLGKNHFGVDTAMSAVKERLRGQGMAYPLFTMGRSVIHTIDQFKAHPGSVLPATGAAWEGFDFPGDCVSLLIIPRLPFAAPDALKEKERDKHPTLRLFIRAVVVPEMQIKLKQGFGRAIRTESATCVVAILDERAARGQRYCKIVKDRRSKSPFTFRQKSDIIRETDARRLEDGAGIYSSAL